MTGLIHQGDGFMVGQHHDPAYSVGSRWATWWTRMVGEDGDGAPIYEDVGDQTGLRVWPANLGQGGGGVVTGAAASAARSREMDAASVVFAAVAMGPGGASQGAGAGSGHVGSGVAGAVGGGPGLPGAGPQGGGGQPVAPLPGGGGGGGVVPVSPGLKYDPNTGTFRGPRTGSTTPRFGERLGGGSGARATGTGPIKAGAIGGFARFQGGATNAGRSPPSAKRPGLTPGGLSYNPNTGTYVKKRKVPERKKKPVRKPSAEGRSLGPRYIAHAPVRSSSGNPDLRFQIASVRIDDADSSVPAGVPGIALAGTEEQSQENLWYPLMRRVIVPGRSGAPEMGTLFCDLEPDDVVAKGTPPGVGGRQSLPQTMMRVARFPTELAGVGMSEGNTLCWNLRDAEQGGFCGYGAVWGRGQSGAAGSAAVTPRKGQGQGARKTGGASTIGTADPYVYVITNAGNKTLILDAALQNFLRGWTGAGASRVSAGGMAGGVQAPAAGPAVGQTRREPTGQNVAALMSTDAGGPFSVGYPDDLHRLGSTKDGEPINSGAFAHTALWERNRTESGPKEFSRLPYPLGAKVYDNPIHVFEGWDASSSHTGPYGTVPGMWRRFSYIPFVDDNGPPPTGPPPVTREPDDPGPREPNEPPTRGPVTPGSAHFGAAGAVVGIRSRAQPGNGKDAHVMYQRAVGVASMLFRPQTTYSQGVDMRFTNGVPAAVRRADLDARPASMRLEAYAKESGGSWSYIRPKQASRIPGGETIAGGLALMPPGYDIVDYAAGSAPITPAVGEHNLTLVSGVALAYGIPQVSDGVVANGGYRVYDPGTGPSVQERAAGAWGTWTPTADANIATKKYVDDHVHVGASREYPVPLSTWVSAGGTDPAPSNAAAGQPPKLQCNGSSGASVTTTFTMTFEVPTGYDQSAQTIFITARVSVFTASETADTIDMVCKEGDGTGSDIISASSQALSGGFTDYDFSLTDTDLIAGDQMNVIVTVVQDDSTGANSPVISINRMSVTVG